MPDKVAPYGLSGVVEGAGNQDYDPREVAKFFASRGAIPKPGAGESALRGIGQGATAGFADELGARMDQGISKVPGLRDAAQWLRTHTGLGDPAALPVNDPSITYEQRRDALRGRDAAAAEAHPVLHGAGEIAGGAVLPSKGIGTAVATGAASGLGHSEAPDATHQLLDVAEGAGAGLAAHGVSKALGAAVKGATGRAENRAFRDIQEGAGKRAKDRIIAEEERVRSVMKEEPFRKAAGKPEEMLQVVEEHFNADKPAADRILDVADRQAAKAAGQVGHGGMRVQDVTIPLHALKQQMIDASESDAAIHAVDTVIDQFRRGIGRDPNALVPSTTVRKFLTDQVQRLASKGNPLADPTNAGQEAYQRAAGMIKDALTNHVQKHASDTAVSGLRKLWDRMTAYSAIRGAAEEAVEAGKRAPSSLAGIAAGLKEVRMTPEAAVGGAVGGVPGAIVAGAAGAGVRKAAPIIDTKLATPAGQRIGAAVARKVGPALSQPVIDALSTKDPQAGKAALARELFGEE